MTAARTFDAVKRFDERSRGYNVADAPVPRVYHNKLWSLRLWLDQGAEGACAGFSTTHSSAADPFDVAGQTNESAQALYEQAQTLDEWPGEDYEGTSVLAAMKAAVANGWFTGYRWSFTMKDLIYALGSHGPCVLGLNWYEGMEEPTAADHFRVHPTGDIVGRHAICARGVSVTSARVRLHNSWGRTWGAGGCCFISFTDLDRLLHEDGEACFPYRA